MFTNLYSIKDELSGFSSPVTIVNDELAKRWFKTLMTTEAIRSENKSDFSLWYMGTFDEENGTIVFDKVEMQKIMKGEECNA